MPGLVRSSSTPSRLTRQAERLLAALAGRPLNTAPNRRARPSQGRHPPLARAGSVGRIPINRSEQCRLPVLQARHLGPNPRAVTSIDRGNGQTGG